MGLVKLPKFFAPTTAEGSLYDLGEYSQRLVNGYLTFDGHLRRMPGPSEFCDLDLPATVDGWSWNENTSTLLAACDGGLYRFKGANATSKEQVNSTLPIDADANIRFAHLRDPQRGQITFVADGTDVKILTEETSVVFHDPSTDTQPLTAQFFSCAKTNSSGNPPVVYDEVNLVLVYNTEEWTIGAEGYGAAEFFVGTLLIDNDKAYICKKDHDANTNPRQPLVNDGWQDYWKQTTTPARWASDGYYTRGYLESLSDFGTGDNAPQNVSQIVVFDPVYPFSRSQFMCDSAGRPTAS